MFAALVQKPFSTPFLSSFVLTPQLLPFSDDEVTSFDTKLSDYEQVFLNPDVEKNLITKNELLASFAISKAENSQLTLTEAQDLYQWALSNPNFDFLSDKL